MRSPKTLHDFRRRMYAAYGPAPGELFPQDPPAGVAVRMPFLRQMVHRHFPPARDAVILDLGCGHGDLIQVLRTAGYTHVRGVDASPSQVSLARGLGFTDVVRGDLMAALKHADDASLDVVVALDVLEHFTRPELGEIAERVRQVLKPSGRWIIHTLNGASPFAGRSAYGDITHETLFTRNSLRQMLKAYGFGRIRCFEDRPVPHGLVSACRYLLWMGLRSLLMLYVAVETGDLDRQGIFSQNFTAVARPEDSRTAAGGSR
jgi:SAM-dependent methyltransferase